MARVIAWKRSQVDQAQDSPVFRSRMDAGVNDSREQAGFDCGVRTGALHGHPVSDHLSTARREASASLQMNSGSPNRRCPARDGWSTASRRNPPAKDLPPPYKPKRHRWPRRHWSIPYRLQIHRALPTTWSVPATHSSRYASDTTEHPIWIRRWLATTGFGSQSTGCTNTPASTQCPCAHRLADDQRHLGRDVPISKPVEQQDGKMGAYKVQSGDTLSELAQKLLGSARETDRLYELNRDVLRDQNDLRVGASLRYPLSN